MERETTTYHENLTKDRVFSVPCVSCSRDTKHKVISSYNRHDEWSDDQGHSMSWGSVYQIIQCQGCESISFRSVDWHEHDWDPETGQEISVSRLYPKRDSNSLKPSELPNVPTALRRIYTEIVDCFNNESATLCAAGLRALVEGVCADQGVVDGLVPDADQNKPGKRRDNLEGKIYGLQERGILTKQSAQSLHDHRYMGNEAVHQLARPSQEELRLAIDLVQHMLEQLYEIPEKALQLKARRAAKIEPKGTDDLF